MERILCSRRKIKNKLFKKSEHGVDYSTLNNLFLYIMEKCNISILQCNLCIVQIRKYCWRQWLVSFFLKARTHNPSFVGPSREKAAVRNRPG